MRRRGARSTGSHILPPIFQDSSRRGFAAREFVYGSLRRLLRASFGCGWRRYRAFVWQSKFHQAVVKGCLWHVQVGLSLAACAQL